MPRGAKPIGDRPLTGAERAAKTRERHARQTNAMRYALRRIQMVRTIAEARELATAALAVS